MRFLNRMIDHASRQNLLPTSAAERKATPRSTRARGLSLSACLLTPPPSYFRRSPVASAAGGEELDIGRRNFRARDPTTPRPYPPDTGVALTETATGRRARIGPVIGSMAMLELGSPGVLGNAGFGVRFHPPTAIGLSIDAADVTGGGFIYSKPPDLVGDPQFAIGARIGITRLHSQAVSFIR